MKLASGEAAAPEPASDERGSSGRAAGVLLHPTCLPGPWGAGDFGPPAEAFLRWAESAGLGLWQVLPLHPPARGRSPYTAFSAFALDPLFISPERLVADGLLIPEDLPAPLERPSRCDFEAARRLKLPLLKRAFKNFRSGRHPGLERALEDFAGHPLRRGWLEDWCLFAALKERRGGERWTAWEEGLRRRRPEALRRAREEFRDAVAFEKFLQLMAHRHWRALRDAAASRGVEILGDLPIYVAHESAEVWTHARLFELDEAGQPTAVAGVPPDYFSADGQLWGNPLYRWDALEKEGFGWWIDRLRAQLDLADLVRLDHFRAFADYWRVPAGAETARDGDWRSGPGRALFRAFEKSLGSPLPVIAEDLGDLSNAAHALRRKTDLPGMRVLHFAFETPHSEHAPHRLEPETLLYTATHDNDTSLGWFRGLPQGKRSRVLAYAGCEAEGIHRGLIRLALTSVARWAVFPLQDVLGLGREARFNTPGVAGGESWRWRCPELPGEKEARWLRGLIEATGRLPPAVSEQI
ncbi:MAG: 4-alpha-glucanotransferase [Acidobacteriota bacterium]